MTAGLVKLREDAKAAREYQKKLAQQAIKKEKDQQIKMVTAVSENVRITQQRAIAPFTEDLHLRCKELNGKTAEIQNRTKEIAKIEKLKCCLALTWREVLTNRKKIHSMMGGADEPPPINLIG